MGRENMGRKNKVSLDLTDDEMSHSDDIRKATGAKHRDIYVMGLKYFCPGNVVADRWKVDELRRRRKDILRDADRECLRLEALLRDQRSRAEKESEDIDRQINLYEYKVDDRDGKVESLWVEFVTMYPALKDRCSWNDSDMDLHPWFRAKGVDVTYGELRKKVREKYSY